MLNRLISWRRKATIRETTARRVDRYPVHAMVSLVLENGAMIHGVLANMGTRGCFIVTPDRPFGLNVGEEGDLGLATPDGSPDSEYRFSCRLVWIDRDGVGVEFLIGNDAQDDVYYATSV